MMKNGFYDIKLTAEDTNRKCIEDYITLQIDGDTKVGNFTMEFEDLSIPVSGIPITINRKYDSRNKQKGDFGIGWTLGIKNIEITTSGVLGEEWLEVISKGGILRN